jgi:uncharacterized protein (AIM24 family)
MTDVEQRIQCRWCHAQSLSSARTCDRCGAPLDVRDVVSDSGWREAPRLRDMTEFHWAASSCQLDAGVVPVAEVTLDAADSVFFEHHVMLWKDESAPMSVMSTPGGTKRLLSGLPFVLSVARGPGRVAFSRDAAGEFVVVPIDPPSEIDVREHALLLATGTLTYSFEKFPGLRAMLAADAGIYLDRYAAQGGPGLLVLHGYGNVFQRTLQEGESILVDPGAFLYKDGGVRIEVVSINFKTGATSGSPSPGTPTQGGASAGAATSGDAWNTLEPQEVEYEPASSAPQAPQPAQQGGRFGRGLRGLKAARSMLNVGALTSAAENLRSGGGLQGLAAGLASAGGSTLFRVSGPGRVGIQSMFRPSKSG